MTESSQGRILKALLAAIRPIAKALMQCGIGHREFSEIAKTAFVQVATEEYGLRGRPTNVSRVSVITGVSRKEVAKIRSSNDGNTSALVKGTPAGEVLHRWNTDTRYFDSSGSPVNLPYEGGQRSFKSLVKEVAGDIPPGAMKSELLRISAIEEEKNGTLKVTKRHYVPARIDDRLLHGLDTAIRYLADTIAYNTEPSRTGEFRFERVVSSVKIKPEAFEEIAKYSTDRLEAFTEEYDDFLSRQEDVGSIGKPSNEIGVGFYFFRANK